MSRTQQSVRVDEPVGSGADANHAARTGKPLRADAARNREKLVTAASELYSERGIDAPLDEIARRAGVGIGTLYRHFPARDNVIEAVYRHEVELLCDGVDDLLAANPPDEALEAWMRSFAEYVAKKRGMAMALKSVLGADSELFKLSHDRIRAAARTLLAAAAAAGSIRGDIEPDDLIRALGGICMATDTPDWSDRTARLVSLLMDGLRYGA